MSPNGGFAVLRSTRAIPASRSQPVAPASKWHIHTQDSEIAGFGRRAVSRLAAGTGTCTGESRTRPVMDLVYMQEYVDYAKGRPKLAAKKIAPSDVKCHQACRSGRLPSVPAPYASHGRRIANSWRKGSSDVKHCNGSHLVHMGECTLARHRDMSKSAGRIAGFDG